MAHVASIAVQQQMAWQGQHAQVGEKADDLEVAGAAAGGCLRSVYIAGARDQHEAKRHPEGLIPADCTAVSSALHGLAAQCAMLHGAESAEGGSHGQAALRSALQVHVAGVHGDVLGACNKQLAEAAVPHRMLTW